jgi:hypothetical protein
VSTLRGIITDAAYVAVETVASVVDAADIGV